jgi:hypothetical protein
MEKTALILGAGFSVPYGYPNGETLVSLIIDRWKQTSLQTKEHLKDLAIELENSGESSIDKFLSTRERFLTTGIEAIVHELIEAEENSINYSVKSSEDIIKLLIRELQPEDFKNLKIITFNYDRHLEWKLFKRLRTTTQNATEAFKLLNEIDIIHIHGRMPALSQDESLFNETMIHVPYAFDGLGIAEQKLSFEKILKHAQNSFKTIYTNNDTPVPAVVTAIKEAKRIFFLGFSYDEKNMKKLGFNVSAITYDLESKYIAGTSFGLKEVETNKIIRQNQFLKGRLMNFTAKEFFEKCFSLTNVHDDQVKLRVIDRSCCKVTAIQERNDPPGVRDLIMFGSRVLCTTCGNTINVTYVRNATSDPWQVEFPMPQPYGGRF